jgi:hypothetical protein
MDIGYILEKIKKTVQSWIEGYFLWQAHAPTFGGFSANPTGSYRYIRIGHLCIFNVRNSADGTSNANTYTMSAPIVAATVTNGAWNTLTSYAVDNGAALTTPGRVTILSGSSTITIYKDMASAAWTTSNGKRANFLLIYEV